MKAFRWLWCSLLVTHTRANPWRPFQGGVVSRNEANEVDLRESAAEEYDSMLEDLAEVGYAEFWYDLALEGHNRQREQWSKATSELGKGCVKVVLFFAAMVGVSGVWHEIKLAEAAEESTELLGSLEEVSYGHLPKLYLEGTSKPKGAEDESESMDGEDKNGGVVAIASDFAPFPREDAGALPTVILTKGQRLRRGLLRHLFRVVGTTAPLVLFFSTLKFIVVPLKARRVDPTLELFDDDFLAKYAGGKVSSEPLSDNPLVTPIPGIPLTPKQMAMREESRDQIRREIDSLKEAMGEERFARYQERMRRELEGKSALEALDMISNNQVGIGAPGWSDI